MVKKIKHWCQENLKHIHAGYYICEYCGNEWYMGRGWIKNTPSFRNKLNNQKSTTNKEK
jgi:hypothetical protein